MLAVVLVGSKREADESVGPALPAGLPPELAENRLIGITKMRQQRRPGAGSGLLELCLRSALGLSHYHKANVKARGVMGRLRCVRGEQVLDSANTGSPRSEFLFLKFNNVKPSVEDRGLGHRLHRRIWIVRVCLCHTVLVISQI